MGRTGGRLIHPGPTEVRFYGARRVRSCLKHLQAFGVLRTLLGHADPPSRKSYGATSVKTTEIYTHVAKGVGAMGVRSPLDRAEYRKP